MDGCGHLLLLALYFSILPINEDTGTCDGVLAPSDMEYLVLSLINGQKAYCDKKKQMINVGRSAGQCINKEHDSTRQASSCQILYFISQQTYYHTQLLIVSA